MEKWSSLMLITMMLMPTKNQSNKHGCSYENSGKTVTCLNVSEAFFQYSNINLNRARLLVCRQCSLDVLSNDTFAFQKNSLKNLVLSEDNVTDIGEGSFTSMTHLQSIDLKGNLLKSLRKRVFEGLKKVLLLDLSMNRLEKLENDTFGLENLNVLDLHKNFISFVDSGAFSNLSSLQYLYLHNNKIAFLDKDMFIHMPRLKVLKLDDNLIKEVHPSAFNKLHSLNHLYMNNNSIEILNEYNFKPLTSLIDLQLRFNRISEIATSTFNGLKSIRFLYLGYNRLTKAQPYGFIGLNSLQVLELIGNQFQNFTLEYFRDMESLNVVWLESNVIDALVVEGEKIPNLSTFDLIDNNLQYFDYRALHRQMPSLKQLWIGQNRWNCTFLIELYDYCQSRNVSACPSENCSLAAVQTYKETICFEPFQNETELSTEYVLNLARPLDYLLSTMLVVSQFLLFLPHFMCC